MSATSAETTFEIPMTPSPDPPPAGARPHRRRGRPLEMTPEVLMQRIRARDAAGQLQRMHVTEPALYARARRLFGSWARALAAAGIDHAAAVAAARRRAHEARRRAAR